MKHALDTNKLLPINQLKCYETLDTNKDKSKHKTHC